MQSDNKRTTAIIVTIAAILLCGCPGLFALCWGVIAAGVSFIPGAEINIGGSSDPQTALVAGGGAVCLGLVFVTIPVIVGFFSLRKKSSPMPTFNETIPPTS